MTFVEIAVCAFVTCFAAAGIYLLFDRYEK
jgi:hypothetical protein